MPVVDCVVVLDAGVGTLPCGLCDFSHQRFGVDGLNNRTIEAGLEPERAALLERAHELFVHSHRVVGVLVLHARHVATAEIHVVAGVAKHPDPVSYTHLTLPTIYSVSISVVAV